MLLRTVFKPNILYRSTKAAEGNFVKINLKKKSHVKGYALRGVGLRKQVRCERSYDPRMDGWMSELISSLCLAIHGEVPAERGALWRGRSILWQRKERWIQRGVQSAGGHMLQVWRDGTLGHRLQGTR